MPSHSQAAVQAYLRVLRRAGAPDALIKDFEGIVEIDNGIGEERGDLESLDRLLLDVVRRHGFSKVYDKPGRRA